jgi:hypothetical protein
MIRMRVSLRVAAVTIILAAPAGSAAQSFVCRPIAPGESAPGLALRLAGNEAARYGERFQIRDPARGVFVPKSQYARLSVRWQVCVAQERPAPDQPTRVSAQPHPAPVVAATALAVPAPLPATHYDVGLAVRVGVAATAILLVCALSARAALSHVTPRELQEAGEEFIGAFVRPLIEPGCMPPIEVRLRFLPRSRQLEICLAPSGGRRYPNLRDHKRNVEYDVDRIVRLLAPHVVVRAPLRAEGKWVVVPIGINDQREAGAR